MILRVNNQDISQLVEKIVWSGDTRQVARKLEFSIVSKESDYYLSNPILSEGNEVVLLDNEKMIFYGILFDIDKSGEANTISYLAFDLMYYVNNSDISNIFDGTAEKITELICKELGIPLGIAEPTNVKIYMPCLSKKAYEGIMMAYTAASRKNGKKYMPIMQNGNELFVIEKGIDSGVIMDGSYNLTNSSYKISMQNLVNKVLITDKTGKIVDTITDKESMGKYGTIQKVYTQEDTKDRAPKTKKDAKVEAQKLLKGVSNTATITGISDIRAVSGYAAAIQDTASGLVGRFFIESDTHTFENGKSIMQLNLTFENIMDEIELEELKLEKSSTKKKTKRKETEEKSEKTS